MKKFFCLLILASTAASCHHIYYAPNTANAPLLSVKGETRINAFYSSGNESQFEGAELQLAHAITKNIGVMINGFAAGKLEEVSSLSASGTHKEKGNGQYIEAAVGYFKPLDPAKKLVAEVYGGIGRGAVKNDYGFGDNSTIGITKFFVQPSIGYKMPYFEVALVPKLSFVKWNLKESNIQSKENASDKADIETIKNQSRFFAFEPAFFIRGGAKEVKLQAGFSLSKINLSPGNGNDLGETGTFHIGISINLKPGKN